MTNVITESNGMRRSEHCGKSNDGESAPFARFDLAVLCFVLFNTFADQDKDLAVGGAPLIIGDNMQLIQHFFIYADRKTLNCHINLKTNILCIYFKTTVCYNVEYRYNLYLKYV